MIIQQTVDLKVAWDFPGSSAGRKSACNAGDPGSIHGLGRSPGEGIVYPFQYFEASLVTQSVKKLPAMWETWVRSLGWEDPWRRAWQPTPVFLPGDSPWTEEPGRLQTMGVTESDMIERLSTAHIVKVNEKGLPW